MKTIADLKRAMIPGTHWLATHRYIGQAPTPETSMGIRKVIKSTSSMATFKTSSGITSRLDWPLKSEFSMDGDTVVITREGFCQLRYTPQ